MKKLKTRFFIVCLSLVVGLLCFEILFRVFYWGSQKLHAHQVKTNIQSSTILCVGNSFTLGVGAPAGESYPDHLQKLILNNPRNNNYQVINLGRGAFNTSLVLENLETWLTSYLPRYVLFQVGEPNHWNRYGHERFLGIEPHTFKDFIQNHSAIYRYFIYLKNMKELEKASDGDFNFRKEKAILNEKDGPTFQAAKELSMNCYISDWQIEARENLKNSSDFLNLKTHLKNAEKAYSKFPDIPASARVLYHLKLSCQNNYSEAFPYLKKLLELEPEKKMVHFLNTLTSLNSPTYAPNRKIKDKNDFFNFLQKEYPAYIPLLNEEIAPRINDWIISDLKKMIKLTSKWGAIPIILNYPPRPNGEPRDVDSLLRTLAFQENIYFVDIEKFFNQIWENKTYKKEELHEVRMGIPVEHLNGLGYKKMAEEVFNEMKKLKLL